MTLEWRRRPLFYAAIAVSIALVVWFHLPFHSFSPHPLESYSGQQLTIGGTVVSDVEERESFGRKSRVFTLAVRKVWVEGAPPAVVSDKAKVYLRAPVDVAYGDVIVLKGEMEAPRGVRNPGGFDQRAYLDRQGIHGLFFTKKDGFVKVLERGKGHPVLARALSVRHALSDILTRRFEKREAAFLKALFLGERGGLDEDFKELFVKTGTMHILAVSGFNIGFLLFGTLLFLKPFPVSIDWKLRLSIAVVWFYCLIVGWQPSVVRASVMATVLLLGRLLGRKVDTLNALGLAALAILAVHPKEIFDVGFQLSFLAVFGIVAAVPMFLQKPERLPNEPELLEEKTSFYVKELFWVSFVCLFATLPVTVQNFYAVSPLSIAANLVVVPLAFVIFIIGLVYFGLFWAGLAAVGLAATLHGFISAFTRWLILIERVPGSYVVTGKLDAFLWTALVAGMAWIVWGRQIKRPAARALVLCAFTASLFIAQDALRLLDRSFRMTVLDVGQGDAIYVEYPGGNLLVDAGKGYPSDKGRLVVEPFLKSKGVRTIDLLVMTHGHEDHIGGISTILDEFRVRHVLEGKSHESDLYKRVQKAVRKEKTKALTAGSGGRVTGFPELSIDILNPDLTASADKKINNDSLVLRLTYGNTSFLLTGDVEETAMERMLYSGHALRSDVLKVPHHGGKHGEKGRAFIEKVSPGFSVISVSAANPFGHPRKETIEALTGVRGNRTYRTDRHGAVQFVSDGEGLKVFPFVVN